MTFTTDNRKLFFKEIYNVINKTIDVKHYCELAGYDKKEIWLLLYQDVEMDSPEDMELRLTYLEYEIYFFDEDYKIIHELFKELYFDFQ